MVDGGGDEIAGSLDRWVGGVGAVYSDLLADRRRPLSFRRHVFPCLVYRYIVAGCYTFYSMLLSD